MTAFLIWFLAGRAWASGEELSWSTSRRKLVASVLLCTAACSGWVGVQEIRLQAALGNALRARDEGDCIGALNAARGDFPASRWRRREGGIAAMIHFRCQANPEVSLMVLEQALSMHPNHLNLLLATGARRLKSGQPMAAKAAFSHSLKIGPRLGRAWLGLAMTRASLGEHAEAAKACRQAIRLDPEFEPARVYCYGNRYLP